MSQEYVHGYTTASKTMAVRTAEREAAYFLPYLEPGMKLLDAGCGPGTITVGLAEAVAPGQVFGFDIGESEIERSTELAKERGITNARFQVADSKNLPFEDESFDAVFSSAMLEHVPGREQALDEMIRVLKPGGLIGLRGGYLTGHVVGPDNDAIRSLITIYNVVWKSRGGESDFGIRQMPLLVERNMVEVRQTASFETRDPTDTDYANRIVTDQFINAARELGISTSEELHKVSAGLIEHSKNPIAYSHICWIEVTARKPS